MVDGIRPDELQKVHPILVIVNHIQFQFCGCSTFIPCCIQSLKGWLHGAERTHQTEQQYCEEPRGNTEQAFLGNGHAKKLAEKALGPPQ